MDMPDAANPPPAVGDIVSPTAALLVEVTPRQGRVVSVADDGKVTAEFDQWPNEPMILTGPGVDFTVVHRLATDGPTWDDFLAEVSEQLWMLFPKDFVEAGHRDLCHPLCHQNLMEAVRTAVDTCWAQWHAKAADAKESAA